VEDVRFDNWTMENVGTGIVVTSYHVMGGESATTEEPVSERTPVFRNIAMSNVTVKDAKQAADIEGLPEMPIAGLRISNLTATGKNDGFIARRTVDLELHNLLVDLDTQYPYFLIQAKGSVLDNVTSRRFSNVTAVVRLEGCKDTIVRNSRAYPGTEIFLSTEKGQLGSVQLMGNDLREAKTPVEEANFIQ
jgi:hypothetical protein